MSTALKQIQDAETKAEKIIAAAEKKAHQNMVSEEEKAHQKLHTKREKEQEKQEKILQEHKAVCTEKFEKEEKKYRAEAIDLKKKWEGNTQSAADFLMKAFQKYFQIKN